MSKTVQEENDIETSYYTLVNEYDKLGEAYDTFNNYYFDGSVQFVIKHNGEPREETFETSFDWLLERDYEFTLRSSVDSLKYYANEYYNKFVS